MKRLHHLNHQLLTWSLIGLVGMSPSQSKAVSFLSFDPRSMAMGGAVIAIARPYNASLYNPALLLPDDSYKGWLYFTRPFKGAHLIDRDNFIEAVEDYIDNESEQRFDTLLERAKTDFKQGRLNAPSLRELADTGRQWRDDITSLSNKPLRASISEGFSVSVTGDDSAWGGHVRNYSVLGAKVNIADIDIQRIEQAIELIDLFADISDQLADTKQLAAALDLPHLESLILDAIDTQVVSDELSSYYDLPTVQAFVEASMELGRLVQSLDTYFQLDELVEQLISSSVTGDVPKLSNYLKYQIPETFESTVAIQGAEVTETSLSYAWLAQPAYRLTFGVNMKWLSLTTIDAVTPIGNVSLDDYKNPLFHQSHDAFNLDFGMYYNVTHALSFAAVVKNIIPDEFGTVDGNIIRYRPLVRVGASYVYDDVRIAIDFDVTKNDPLGFDQDKQYLAVGVEYKLWQNTAFRAGLRTNLVTGVIVPSIGLGIGSYRAHLDLAVTKSQENDEIGAALQIGIGF